MGLGIAVKAFWAFLRNEEKAKLFVESLTKKSLLEESSTDEQIGNLSLPLSDRQTNGRSEAVELLASLQREARFVDFIKENISECDNETLGAAVRKVHAGCANVLERCFSIRPLSSHQEGTTIKLTSEEAHNMSRVQLNHSREITQEVQGRVVHCGWQVTKCIVPKWTGRDEDKMVVAPVQVENS